LCGIVAQSDADVAPCTLLHHLQLPARLRHLGGVPHCDAAKTVALKTPFTNCDATMMREEKMLKSPPIKNLLPKKVEGLQAIVIYI
jgi:hypothetical protein